MIEKSIVRYVAGLLAAACVALAFVLFDAGVRSQNTNTSTTAEEDANANANTNAAPRRRGRRGRRGSRATMPATQENTNTGEGTEGENTNQRPEVIINREAAPEASTQDTGGGAQEDLSATCTGRLTMTGGHEMSSNDATITITGNTFTLTADGMTHSGRIYAVNTRRYIGAALIFTDLTDPVTNTPLACSVRVRRTGTRLSATPVPGARNRLTFNGRCS
ncbi:MAG TPA: hypothetical protein VER32_07025 [Pyrinomonadaceae bacterium]|nr:hypothetical protein [Pyrinomonadaceae bacterium]